MSSAPSKKQIFFSGLKGGIPIALGYLSVSFAFGISAAEGGLSPLSALLISMTNLTSAGQLAGLSIIFAGGSLFEMALTQLTINLRYFLMSLSLSQHLAPGFSTPHRLLCAFGITDEIYAVASMRSSPVTPSYLYGLILLPYLGWSTGTALGALAGHVLPGNITSALGIAIYGMFVAIVLPPAKRERGVLFVSLSAIALSCTLSYVPLFSRVSSGFAIIICALVASALGAWLFPRKEPGQEDKNT